jgi:predicted phosphodiesterase
VEWVAEMFFYSYNKSINHPITGDAMPRLAVMSDIHGNLVAFEAVLADFVNVGTVDKLWILGDLAAFGPQAAACVERVQQLKEHYGDQCQVIGGNTDRYLVTGKRSEFPIIKKPEDYEKATQELATLHQIFTWNRAQLSWANYEFLANTLGRELHWRVKGYGDVIGYHAIPGDDEPMSLRPDTPEEEALDALLDREGRLAIGGHTHLRMDRPLKHWRVVNPGSVGLSFSQKGRAEWALITIEDNHVEVDLRGVLYDVERVIAEAQAIGYPNVKTLMERLNYIA